MLTNEQFEAWCYRFKISEATYKLIKRIRASEPSRKVKSSAANVSGLYCSKKMGLTMQFESHTVELPLVVTYMEWEDDVLEYYDQPEPIKLNYKSVVGRNLGVIYTPDFFVIRSNSAGYEEYKTEQELEKLSANNKERYFKDEKGIWRCPPGEKFAAQFGLYFRVRSSAEINLACYRNLEYLQDYFRSPTPVNLEVENIILAIVHSQEGITFQEIVELRGSFTADDINNMLASGGLYFDIHKDCFDDPRSVEIYSSRKQAEFRKGVAIERYTTLPSPIEISVGKTLDWDGVIHQIINVGEHTITLKSDSGELLSLNFNQVEQLFGANQLTISKNPNASSLSEKAQQMIKNASLADLESANQRAAIVKQYLSGEKDLINVPARTVRDWVKKYNLAKQMWGEGYIGLIAKTGKKGNRVAKLSTQIIDIIKEVIKEHYENGIQTSKIHAYGFLQKACTEIGSIVPSYVTFCSYIKNFSTQYDQTLHRQGTRAAYDYQSLYWELDQTTPRHGSRPFEVVHIDHTEFDIQLKSPEGRPWGTIMTDAYTRRFLAVYITMDPPSYRSNMMVIRECVKRFSRLPQNIIVDGGKDFHGTYFEQLLARYEVNKKTRPKAKGRFGSVCERLFGTSNTQLIHNLVGNTQLTKEVRKVTKKFNPKNLAVWDLESFNELFKLWAYEFYDTDDHPALGESPREVFIQGMELTGYRKNRLIQYDRNFEFSTLPTTRKGTAKIFSGRGFKIKNVYYWSDEFRIPENEGKTVEVRYDPWNIAIAYAFIKGSWVECISQYYSIFHGRTEKELIVASEEIRKNQSNSNKKYIASAAKLAEFFQKNVRMREKEFTEQNEMLKRNPVLKVLKGSEISLSDDIQQSLNEKIKTLPTVNKRTVPRQIYEEY